MMEDDDSAVIGEADSSLTASILLPGQGASREFIIENQSIIQSSLVTEHVEVIQNQTQGIQNQVTGPDVPDLVIASGSSNNKQSESQMGIEQREAISGFLADGLKKLTATQVNAGPSRVLGSLNFPSSLIHIDLAALGITSLKIAVNIPDSSNATLAASHGAPQLMMTSFGDIQLHPKLPAMPKNFHVKAPQITKVYYRRRFKNKGSSFDKQYVEVANQSNTNSVFGNAGPAFEPQYDNFGRSKENPIIQKRKCSTPTTTMKLRRSPRFIEKLDGHKPVSVPLKKASFSNKGRSNKVKPQSDLLGNILLSPTYQASEFPGLSTITKFADMGIVFPQIPIAEIQKLAIDSCCISPSEVSAELLLASRPEKDVEAAVAPEDAFMSQ